jgi:hypothetical protein
MRIDDFFLSSPALSRRTCSASTMTLSPRWETYQLGLRLKNRFVLPSPLPTSSDPHLPPTRSPFPPSLGTRRALCLPRFHTRQGGPLCPHRRVQSMDGLRRRGPRGRQEGRRHASHRQLAVRPLPLLLLHLVLTDEPDCRTNRMDDVEDDSHLRRGMPGASRSFLPFCSFSSSPDPRTVAHKIYGIPQTINSANYVYFLAYQELQRIKPRAGSRVEETVTRASL